MITGFYTKQGKVRPLSKKRGKSSSFHRWYPGELSIERKKKFLEQEVLAIIADSDGASREKLRTRIKDFEFIPTTKSDVDLSLNNLKSQGLIEELPDKTIVINNKGMEVLDSDLREYEERKDKMEKWMKQYIPELYHIYLESSDDTKSKMIWAFREDTVKSP